MGKPVPSCDAHSFCAGMLFDVLPSSRIGNTKASSNTTTHEACGDNHKIVGSDTHSGDDMPAFVVSERGVDEQEDRQENYVVIVPYYL